MRAALVTILVLAAGAHAQPPNANAHARRGVALYNLGKYDDAIRAFEDAYTLFQSDALLFNLAQAHRQLGHCEIALGYYKRFMAGTPAPTLAAQVETLLPKLEAACRTKDERPAGPVATPEAAPAAPAPTVATTSTFVPDEEPAIEATAAPALPRIRATAALTAGSVMSNRSAPIAGVKASLATPLPWLPVLEVGVTAATARLFRAEADRQAGVSSVAVSVRLGIEQSWARLTIGADAGTTYISSLDTSSGVIPGVRRAGLWVPLVRAEAGAERSIRGAFAVRVAIAAGISPRSGPMLDSMTQVDLVVGVRYER